MDPNALLRWVTSSLMTYLSGAQRLNKRRAKAEKARVKSGSAHVVEYFHQVEDGYSHLAAQVLQSLASRYDIELVCHLVPGPQGKNVAEPELLLQLSRYDAFHVAGEYGLAFPRHDKPLAPELVKRATAILAAQDNQGFIERAAAIGRAMWAGDEAALEQLADEYGRATDATVSLKLAAGQERRDALKHYSGAMFYYGDEWYWGVDRLYHLEQRFAALGIDKKPAEPLLVPRPEIEAPVFKDNGSLTLEIYPSLRSPYTAISFDRAVQLARDTGVNLEVRPVLPMVMRGVPATRQKGMYIFWDTAREARAAGVPFGNFYDPIGNPARNGYSLFSWAQEQGRGIELISAFLRCAFVQGVNINKEKGLREVVEQAGLDWSKAQQIVGQPGWEEALESNRLSMYKSGLWGVPSFRLLDASGKEILALWGQDRLWLFAREIQRQLAARQATQ
ncbi:2-hydroxychromene-2-carboxylate isomerase [Halioglobus japonicus]|nr:2-hydroxychromene-2-carboxylate isomerase [Halioglobus japonicus]